MFENRVLRRIFGPKTDEMTGKWIKLHNEELYNSYSYQISIIWVIKLRRVRWAGHVARMAERSGAYVILVGKFDGTRPLKILRYRWGIILKLIFKK
jgi:hypothetical protein